MDELESLQRRIAQAFQRIEAAAKVDALPDEGLSDPMRHLAETNVQIAAQLDAMRDARARDAAELDMLINRLKPLLAEASNA
jgi:hypothetical protein